MKVALLALISILSCFRLMAQDGRQLVVHLSESGKPFTLNVNISRAAIKVTGYEGKDVVVNVGKDESNGKESLDVTTHEKNNEVTVEGPNRKAIKLDIKVPKTAGIFKLSSVNGGTIIVDDVTGNLELQNKSGGISALNISGSIIAGTLSGRITVSFNKIDPGVPMAFSTISGAIDITFPANLKANLKIKSDHGKVYSAFPVTGDPADWLYGKAGGGGPEMLIKITTGNVHIYKRE
ncbi:MAG TPA: DUF4097 family beta strand repeat-containing protein [Mucilaginibacter sp.]